MKRVRTAIGNDMDAVQGGIFIYFFFGLQGWLVYDQSQQTKRVSSKRKRTS